MSDVSHVTGIQIRQAILTDCPEIARLIRELAEYHGFPVEQNVTLKLEDLQRDGFPSGCDGNNKAPLFQCLVAEDTESTPSGRIIGYALFYPFYSTWKGKGLFLEDFYVEEPYRHEGVGKTLFGDVCRFALETGSNAIRLSVLGSNMNVKQFYDAYDLGGFENFTVDEGWKTGKFGKDALIRISDDCDNRRNAAILAHVIYQYR